MFYIDLIVAPLLSSPSSLLSQTLDPFSVGSGGGPQYTVAEHCGHGSGYLRRPDDPNKNFVIIKVEKYLPSEPHLMIEWSEATALVSVSFSIFMSV